MLWLSRTHQRAPCTAVALWNHERANGFNLVMLNTPALLCRAYQPLLTCVEPWRYGLNGIMYVTMFQSTSMVWSLQRSLASILWDSCYIRQCDLLPTICLDMSSSKIFFKTLLLWERELCGNNDDSLSCNLNLLFCFRLTGQRSCSSLTVLSAEWNIYIP